MVTNILRLSVYNLTRHMMTCVIGHRWAQLFVVFATFVVSRLMHKLMFYYMGLVKPSWEVTWFFLLHGLCLVVEVVMKEVVLAGRFWLPWLISGPLTNGFVIITSFWLFFPPFLWFKVDEKAFEEYAALGDFLKNVILTFIRVHT